MVLHAAAMVAGGGPLGCWERCGGLGGRLRGRDISEDIWQASGIDILGRLGYY